MTSPENGEESAAKISEITAPALILGVKSDILFPVWQQRELAHLLEEAGNAVTYVELDSPYGHDTFLIELDRLAAAIVPHLSAAP